MTSIINLQELSKQSRLIRLFETKDGIEQIFSAHFVARPTCKLMLTGDEFTELRTYLAESGWQFSVLPSLTGEKAEPPVSACPICQLRPGVTLDGYCEVCQAAMGTPDEVEVREWLR